MKLPYGQCSIDFPWSDEQVQVLTPDPISLQKFTVAEQEATLTAGLKNPLSGHSIEKWYAPGDNLAILIPDITRNCSANVILGVIINCLENLGVVPDKVTIIIATGNHRRCTEAELRKLTGDRIFEKYSIMNHNSDHNLTSLGKTAVGNEVLINKQVVDANKVIVIGNVTYHNFAGFSGGRKSILPGVSGRETILNNHRLMLKDDHMHEKCQNGVLDGNPIHQDMLNAVTLLDPSETKIYGVNVVTNMSGQIIAAFAGHLLEVFNAGVNFAETTYKIDVPAQGDLVVCSPGGFPYDINYYQSFKSLVAASQIVKPGGTLILAAECRDGLGDTYEKFSFWFSRSQSEIINELYGNYDVVGQIAYWTKDAIKHFNVWVVTDPNNFEQLRSLGIDPMSKAEFDAFCGRFTNQQAAPVIYTVPYANITYLRIK